MRVLKLQNVRGDGTPSAEAFSFYPDVDPKTGKPYVDEQGAPAIVVMLRTLSREQYRAIVKQHTQHTVTGASANGTGALMQEKVDWDSVNADAAAAAIVGWKGFVGADDKPLVCIEATKRAIDDGLRTAIINSAMYAQPVEVTAESFREPARVPALVGGSR